MIAYGFWARVLTGPTLSPLGQLVTRVITPRLDLASRPVPGPPKRFAQGIGAAFSTTAAVLALGFGLIAGAYVVLGALTVAATLESVLGRPAPRTGGDTSARATVAKCCHAALLHSRVSPLARSSSPG